MSAADRKAREAAKSESVALYRGIVIHQEGGGYYTREVALPAYVVEKYAVDKPTPRHVPAHVHVRVERFHGDPDILRKKWRT
jgi:hypothetical protein